MEYPERISKIARLFTRAELKNTLTDEEYARLYEEAIVEMKEQGVNPLDRTLDHERYKRIMEKKADNRADMVKEGSIKCPRNILSMARNKSASEFPTKLPSMKELNKYPHFGNITQESIGAIGKKKPLGLFGKAFNGIWLAGAAHSLIKSPKITSVGTPGLKRL